MAKPQKPTITIIGAGLAGCFLAILLAKKGYKVRIFEHTAKKEIMDSTSKRSFNITFYGYTVKVLKEAGLWDCIQKNILKIEGTMTQVSKNSNPIFSSLDQEKLPYFSAQRGALLNILLHEALSNPLVTINFGTTLLSIDRYKKTITVRNEKTQKVTTIPCHVVIGADGVNSLTRTYIQQGRESSHSQEYAQWSYKQILFTRQWVKKLGLTPNVAYTWSRKEAVIASFPNKDGSLAAIMTLPKQPKKGFASLTTPEAVKRLITRQFPVLLPALPLITDSFLKNPEGNFVTIHTSPWHYDGFLAILGDAAHGFYPFFGQGTSAAFGDCLELVRLMNKYNDDWNKIFPAYELQRKKHMDTLGELSKKGFILYRRHKRAEYSVIYDHLDALLHRLFPKVFLPTLYESITTDPDHTADHLEKHNNQRKLLNMVGAGILVFIVTGAIALQENLQTLLKKII